MAMTVGEFALAALRLAALLLPALLAAHYLRRRFFSASGAIAVLVETVLALSLLLVAPELAGAASLERFWVVVMLLSIAALAVIVLTRRWPSGERPSRAPRSPDARGPGRISAYVAITVVVAPWGVQTA